MNAIRSVFKVMILSSFILAPLSFMFAAVLVIHPFFIQRILFRFPDVGVFLLFFIGVSIMLASMWLYIGLSEQRFFSNWDKKFSRYTSLKNQLDKARSKDRSIVVTLLILECFKTNTMPRLTEEYIE